MIKEHMPLPPPPGLRWAYLLVVLSAVIPVGLTAGGWVALALGGGAAGAGVPYVGPAILLVLGLYRSYTVVRRRDVLSSAALSGFPLLLRWLGVLGLLVFELSRLVGFEREAVRVGDGARG